MKNFIRPVLLLGLPAALIFPASAGQIKPGAVPATINYHGRLERDNTPVTGPVHLSFRIYNAALEGTQLWPTPQCPASEVTVIASQGIFSATLSPCPDVFYSAERLYLEVQVESDVLSPREPLNSVTSALVAKRLEDGSSIAVTTLTAHFQALLATAAGNVGIGDMSLVNPLNPLAVYPDKKLTVNGGIHILSGLLYFPDGSLMNTASLGAAANVSAASDAVLVSDSDNSGAGDIILSPSNTERARIRAAGGNLGIGAAAPSERLALGGNIANTAASLAVYPRDYLVSRPAVPSNGVFRLMPRDDNSTSAGAALELYTQTDASTSTPVNYTRGGAAMTANGLQFYQEKGGTGSDLPLLFKTAGAERLRIVPGGNIGVGGYPNPLDSLQTATDISANAGLRGGRVSLGSYSNWGNAPGEVRSEPGYHLLFQQSNPYNVGIGTDSPKEKLHVRGNIMADYGLIASTAAVSDTLTVRGNFTANSGQGNLVRLSTTVIYGTLLVTGGFGSDQGQPVHLAATQTITGLNAFEKTFEAASELVTPGRLGVGTADFSFPPRAYLQIGGGQASGDDARAYLVSGAGTGGSKFYFYRGASEAAHYETQNGNNLALVAGNTKSLVDGSYYRIHNSVFWVANGTDDTTPALYVSSWAGNVGIGTASPDPDSKLAVNGNVKITGPASSVIFADGTAVNSAGSGGISLPAVTDNADAAVKSDGDQNGSGKVVLRAGAVDGLVIAPGGNTGIGTQYPVSRLNLRNGDLALGIPYNPYALDEKEDLLVGGNVTVYGDLEQRSASAVFFTAATVAGDVYLSTNTGGRTGVGTDNPQHKLDVLGEANLSGAFRLGGTQRISSSGVLSNTTWNGATVSVPYGGTGATALTGVVHASGAAPFTAGNVVLTGEVSGQLPAANGGTGSDLGAAAAGALPYFSGTGAQSALAAGTQDYLLQANGAAAPGWIRSTRDNAANTLVRRDSGGGFSANNIRAVFHGTVSSATNIRGGAVGSIPYQSAADTTAMLAAGTANYLLQANGAAAPDWIQSTRANTGGTIARRDAGGDFAARNITASTFGGTASSATHLAGGAPGSVPYQSAANATAVPGAAPPVNYAGLSTGTAQLGWTLSTDGIVADSLARRDGYGGLLGNVITATAFEGTFVGGAAYIYNNVAWPFWDYVFVGGGDTGINAGYLTIATANNGTEPIYARQYSWNPGGGFSTVVRTATLLDGSGHATFPGWVYGANLNTTADEQLTNPEYLAGEWGGDKFLRYVTPTDVFMGNTDMTDGLHAAASGAAPAANQFVRTEGSGVAYMGWLNTTSGNNGATAITRVYASNDSRVRYYTLANFTDQVRTAASGTWDINISGNAGTVPFLGTNGSDCASLNIPVGMNASLAAEGCDAVYDPSDLTTHAGLDDAHSATSINTAGAIVRRNFLNNFSAGTITASLTGNISGNAGNITGTLAIARGGTGFTTAANARTALGMPSATGGSASGSWGISITGNAANVTDTVALASGGTGFTTAANARTALGIPSATGGSASGSWGINISGNAADVTGTVAVANGGTGSTTAAGARTNLGLGTIATQSSNSVAITGGSISGITSLAVADGGTGSGTAAGARVNLGMPAADGAGASGPWGISITGNAGSVSGSSQNNRVVCWKSDGSLGYCSAIVGATGQCGTCN